MTKPLYTADRIGIWHAVKHVDEFALRIRGKCGHDFEPTKTQTEKRPHPDVYCAGCKGNEEREAKQQQALKVFDHGDGP